MQYGEKLFGVERPAENADAKSDDEGGEQDIEASIQQELESMKASQKPKARQVFTPVGTGLECVFFMKTMKPVDPVRLVQQICEDAKNCADPRERKCKYINRLTPVMDTDKATEKGMSRVARSVLGPFFELKSEDEVENGVQEATEPKAADETAQACTVSLSSVCGFACS